MKESTKKKKTTAAKKTAEKVSVTQTNSTPKNDNVSTLLIVVLVMVALQLVLSVAILMGSESSSNSDLGEISEQVERLDNFFAANAPGYGDGTAPSVVDDTQVDTTAPQVGEPDIENRPFIGDVDAPITIVEYSDFECPFCGRFYSETYGLLKENYVDTGKVKLVFKDFPLSFHQLAEPSAIASKCVFREAGNDAFFSFHDMIFENQNMLSNSKLQEWAIEVGVSEEAYTNCIEDPTVAAEVQADFAEGQALGVSGTPSFVINGQLLVGAQPFSAFEQVIEAQLN